VFQMITALAVGSSGAVICILVGMMGSLVSGRVWPFWAGFVVGMVVQVAVAMPLVLTLAGVVW
jgi:hypothetical protein